MNRRRPSDQMREPEVIHEGHCCGCGRDRKLYRVAPSRYRCDACIKGGEGRYSVRPVADWNCRSLTAEVIACTDDLAAALSVASLCTLPFGAGIEDRRTGAIDFGFGFGVAVPEPDISAGAPGFHREDDE